MKKYKCHDCGAEFKAATKQELLGVLYDHYIKDHNDIITNVDEKGKKKWMKQFEKDWNTAPVIAE